MSNMGRDPYGTTINAAVSPEEAIQAIGLVQRWWSKNYEGSAGKVGDAFTVRFGNGDRYTMRVAELDPSAKVVWEVTDSYQGWVANSSEWVGTTIVWTVEKEANGVSVTMTHSGLTPALECFDTCSGGWTYLVQQSLAKLLTEGTGLPV